MPSLFIEVLLDQNLAKPLDYSVPEKWHASIQVGMRVEVPLKNSLKKGTISKIKHQSLLPHTKAISQVLSQQTEIAAPLWRLAHWMASYYCTPLQRVLRCFIPVSIRKNVKQKTVTILKIAKPHGECLLEIERLRRKAPAQAEILEKLLQETKGLAAAHFSASSVKALLEKKWIEAKNQIAADSILLEEEFFPSMPKILNDEQKECVDRISESIGKNCYATHLIYGVTGSGKTEVFMQAIQKALDQNKSTILLVPEISLTSQMIERFRARFSEKIAVYHHRVSLGERTAAWDHLRKGEARLVIGARSAIFCPIQNLGLIIVDEEHDSSYKQSEEMPCYHGRDVAVMRGFIENSTVILASATPSLESRYNADIGKYVLHTLQKRATKANLADVRIVTDFKGCFSDELLNAIKKRLQKGEQTLLFLNRRGYHRQQICASCQFVHKCSHCDLALSYHRGENTLKCHLCDERQIPFRKCPQCHGEESMQFKGFGTEHVEKALHAIFPEVRTLRMDRDTTRTKHSHEELFKQFRAHKADVLIGTQMIAKGFHFPSVTLVGVLNTDAALHIPDFRAAEKAFQLLTQVAGRAGRAELLGEVIIQTHIPDHPVFHLAKEHDYVNFYKSEIEQRKQFGYPPFCHLVKLLFTDKNEDKAREKANEMYKMLLPKVKDQGELLPVTPSGHSKVKDLYRFQFFIKSFKMSWLCALLQDVNDAKIDVDPVSMYF